MSVDRYDRLVKIATQSENQRDREDAIVALGQLGDPRAIVPLGELVVGYEDNDALDYRVRQRAAEALGRLGDAQAVPRLMGALEYDSSSSVKVSAARALAQIGVTQIGDLSVLELLITTLEDSNPDVRSAVAEAIGNLLAQSSTQSPADKEAIEALLPLLADSDDAMRDVAEQVLRDLGASAFDVLMRGLKDPNSTIRGASADLLGALKDERARDALQKTYWDDDSAWVRGRAKAAMDELPPVTVTIPKPQFDSTPGQADDRADDQPMSTIDLLRSRAPKEWPSLRGNRNQPPSTASPHTPAPANTSSANSNQEFTLEEIQAMLDNLDVRLAKGEISEATYTRLAQRWQDRLDSLK